uniref:Predicted protein n=1 Tax=Hordeum vulgare subsp. vulgare TaxID=112509 RepID=F2DWK7_HORVV|nr:predicted protein [Hordeum vulgare subsp. vulgare]
MDTTVATATASETESSHEHTSSISADDDSRKSSTTRRWIKKFSVQSLLTRKQVLLVVGMVLCELVIIFGGAAIYYALEGHGDARNAGSIPWTYGNALYFSCVNLCRIGYGDIYPTTKGGRTFFLFWTMVGIPCTAFFMALNAAVILRVILWPRFHAARKYVRTFVQPLQYRRSWWRASRRPAALDSTASDDIAASPLNDDSGSTVANIAMSDFDAIGTDTTPTSPPLSPVSVQASDGGAMDDLSTINKITFQSQAQASQQPAFRTLFGFSPPVWLDHSADSLHFIWFVVSNTGLSPRSRLALFFGSCILFWVFCASIFVFIANFSYLNSWFYTISTCYTLGIGLSSPNSASRGVTSVICFAGIGLVIMLITHVQLLIEARTVRTRVLLPWLFHDNESTLQVTPNMRRALSAAKRLNPEEHLEFLSRLGERDFASMFADRIAVLSLRSQSVIFPHTADDDLDRISRSLDRCCPQTVIALVRLMVHTARARIVVCLFLCAAALLVGSAIMLHLERSADPRWTYLTSVYFGVSSLATIGLGDFSPVTTGGKVFFIFWEVFCAPLFATGASALAMLAFKACNTVRIGSIRVVTGLDGPIELDMSNATASINHSLRSIGIKILNFVLFSDDSLGFLLILVVEFVGAAIFMSLEDLTFLNSLYFCVGYTSTIGLGDIVPLTEGGYVFCIFYGIIGVGIVFALIGKFADAAASLLLYQLVDLTLSTRQLRAYQLASQLTEEELQWLRRKLRNERPLRFTGHES